ncbi:MAG: vitamin K epoxide reductase family protein [Longimicrobiales bacterium]
MSAIETETPPAEEDSSEGTPLNRMAMAVLALAGFMIAGYMLLYEMGVIATIACGTAGSCEAVQASPWAVFLGIPVPLLGVVGYGLILAVALASVQPSLAHDRRIAAALLALSAIAFLFSVYLSSVEAFLIGAWCRWCIGSALIATLLFAFALPEWSRVRVRSHV